MKLARAAAGLKRARSNLVQAAAALNQLRPDVDARDVLVFGGIAAASYGIGQIYLPAAWIAGGAAAFWVGISR